MKAVNVLNIIPPGNYLLFVIVDTNAYNITTLMSGCLRVEIIATYHHQAKLRLGMYSVILTI